MKEAAYKAECGAERLLLPAGARMSAGRELRLCCIGEKRDSGDHQVRHITALCLAKPSLCRGEGERDYQYQEACCPKDDVVVSSAYSVSTAGDHKRR